MRKFRKFTAALCAIAMLITMFATNAMVFAADVSDDAVLAETNYDFSILTDSDIVYTEKGVATEISLSTDKDYTIGANSAIEWVLNTDFDYSLTLGEDSGIVLTPSTRTGLIKFGFLSNVKTVAGEPFAKISVTPKETAKDGLNTIAVSRVSIFASNTDDLSVGVDELNIFVGQAPTATPGPTAEPNYDFSINVEPETAYVKKGATTEISLSTDKDYTIGANSAIEWVLNTEFDYSLTLGEDAGIVLTPSTRTGLIKFGFLSNVKTVAGEPFAKISVTPKDTATDGLNTIAVSRVSIFASNTDDLSVGVKDINIYVGDAPATATPAPTATTAPVTEYSATLNVIGGTGTLQKAGATTAALAADNDTTWTFVDAPAGTKLTNTGGTEKEWYIDNVDLGNGATAYSKGTINETKGEYTNCFEVDRTSSVDFDVDGTPETVSGALKFGGKSGTDYRVIKFTPETAGTLTVYVKHGSPTKANTDVRSLIVAQDTNSTTVSTIGTDKAYVVQTIDLVAGKEVTLSCDNNVALAKMVLTSNGDAPVATATTAPVATATIAPVATATIAPVATATIAPVATATTAPVATATTAPVPTNAPQDYKFAAGTKVSYTGTPNVVGSTATIAVKAADGSDVAVSDDSFTMPAQNVTVTVTYEAATPTATASAAPAPTATASAAPAPTATASAAPAPTATASAAPGTPTSTPTASATPTRLVTVKTDMDVATVTLVNTVTGDKFKLESKASDGVLLFSGEVPEGSYTVDATVNVAGKEIDIAKSDLNISVGNKDIVAAVSTIAESSVKSITIKTKPSKLQYKVGESFDATGMIITVNYLDGKTEDVEYNSTTKGDFTFKPSVIRESGDVQVIYGNRADTVSVTAKKNSTTGSGPSGGSTGSSSTATPAPTDPNATAAPTKEPGKTVFEDVPTSYWAYDYIMDLFNAGIVNGDSATKFLPENPITRAEFTKMAVVLFNIDSTSTTSQFTDVPSTEWFAKYVIAATEAGIVTGVSSTEFAPNDLVTREQMAAIIGRKLGTTSGTAMKYTDAASIEDYAKGYVAGLTEKGYLNGDENGAFRPTDNASRAEASALLDRVYKDVNKDAVATATPKATAEVEATATPKATAEVEATATPSK